MVMLDSNWDGNCGNEELEKELFSSPELYSDCLLMI